MAGALLERGIDPIVLLVAGGDRLPVHRHPLPDRRTARASWPWSSPAPGGTASSSR
jgi:hypothetical protein